MYIPSQIARKTCNFLLHSICSHSCGRRCFKADTVSYNVRPTTYTCTRAVYSGRGEIIKSKAAVITMGSTVTTLGPLVITSGTPVITSGTPVITSGILVITSKCAAINTGKLHIFVHAPFYLLKGRWYNSTRGHRGLHKKGLPSVLCRRYSSAQGSPAIKISRQINKHRCLLIFNEAV